MEQTVPELRPRNVLDLLDSAVRLYRRNFALLLGISAVVLVPFGLTYTVGEFYVTLAIPPPTGGEIPTSLIADWTALIVGSVAVGVSLLIAWVAGPLSQGALALAISEHYLGGQISVAAAYRRALPYWLSLLGVAIIFGLLVAAAPSLGAVIGATIGIAAGAHAGELVGLATGVIATMLGMLAGTPLALLLATWFVFYEQVMVIEGVRGIDSLRRSRELVLGRGWPVFGALALTTLGIFIASMVIAGPASIVAAVVANTRPDLLPHVKLFAQCIQQAVNVFTGPIFMIVQTLVYYDLRIRKEGFDLQMMAAALRGEPITPAAPPQVPSPAATDEPPFPPHPDPPPPESPSPDPEAASPRPAAPR